MCVIVLDSRVYFFLTVIVVIVVTLKILINFFTLRDFRNYFATEDKCLQLYWMTHYLCFAKEFFEEQIYKIVPLKANFFSTCTSFTSHKFISVRTCYKQICQHTYSPVH